MIVSSDRSSNKSWQERCFCGQSRTRSPAPCPYSSKRAASLNTPNTDKHPKKLQSYRYYPELRTICRHPGSLPGPVSVSWWRTCSVRSLLLSLRKRSRGKGGSMGHRTLSFTFRNQIAAGAIRSHRTKLLLNYTSRSRCGDVGGSLE